MNKGSTHRLSTPSSFGSLPPPYLVQPLCTPSPLVGAWTTSTPWSPGSRHPLTWPRILNLPLKVPSPTLLRPAFVHPPSPRLRLGNVDTLAGETPGTPYCLVGASRPLGVTSASCHPPPFINASCGASRRAGVPAAPTVASPSYRICDGPPTPPSSWPGSSTSSVLPRPPARPGGLEPRLWASATCLIVRTSRSGAWLVLTAPWLFRCSLVRVWAPALRPLPPSPFTL